MQFQNVRRMINFITFTFSAFGVDAVAYFLEDYKSQIIRHVNIVSFISMRITKHAERSDGHKVIKFD